MLVIQSMMKTLSVLIHMLLAAGLLTVFCAQGAEGLR
jgi:hypothetical protein